MTRFSCVVDQHPIFYRQALLWAASLLTYGRRKPESLLIHAVGGLNRKHQYIFDSWGIETRTVQRFDARHPCSNKLRQLESESLRDAPYVVLCDCDIAFCETIESYLTGSSIRACVAALPGLPASEWERLYRIAQLEVPLPKVRTAFKAAETLPTYCNGGLI